MDVSAVAGEPNPRAQSAARARMPPLAKTGERPLSLKGISAPFVRFVGCGTPSWKIREPARSLWRVEQGKLGEAALRQIVGDPERQVLIAQPFEIGRASCRERV